VFHAGATAEVENNVLTVSSGGVNQSLDVSGFANGTIFNAQPDTGTGTEVLACFAAGTRIRTLSGEVPVERLREGDRILTAAGETKSISWIGHRRIDCRRHPKPRDIWPVRVRAGAFGDMAPCRDLWLSPDHAVSVDGVLIPIKHLINDISIEQVPVHEVIYHHVELPRHEVLLAEGLPCESYLDTGNRSNFANGGGSVALHPDFSCFRWEAEACAPLIVTGPKLDAVVERVSALARAPTRPPHGAVGDGEQAVAAGGGGKRGRP
jgi:collagen type I/II/III/V/XI/XXIV/XXVII alpha